jgi:hypothetical protein
LRRTPPERPGREEQTTKPLCLPTSFVYVSVRAGKSLRKRLKRVVFRSCSKNLASGILLVVPELPVLSHVIP